MLDSYYVGQLLCWTVIMLDSYYVGQLLNSIHDALTDAYKIYMKFLFSLKV